MVGSMSKLNKPTDVSLFADPDNTAFSPDQDTYFNIPVEYYHQTDEELKLDKEIAAKLDWIVYEEINGTANIATRAQTITIDGISRHINPGLGGLIDAESLYN